VPAKANAWGTTTAEITFQQRRPWTGQAGQDREDGMPGHNSKDWTVVTGELGTRAMEQDSCERTGRTGQVDMI
jgi:hypothetical protein